MFHCNGWCFPWTISIVAGTHVCLRAVRAAAMYDAIATHKVTHLCGAPIVMAMLLNATGGREEAAAACRQFRDRRRAAAGGRAGRDEGCRLQRHPCLRPDRVLRPGGGERVARRLGRAVRAPSRRRRRRARACAIRCWKRSTCSIPRPCSRSRATARALGEVMMRGNVVMKGYLKNKASTEKAFAGGWFHTGDLGVMHPDGYIQLKDRSKDIIISGGENISSIEVEDALYKHPAVARRRGGGQARRQMGRDAVRLRRTEAGRAARAPTSCCNGAASIWPATNARATWCSRRSRRPARGRFRNSNCARWRRRCEATCHPPSCPALCRASTPSFKPAKTWMAGTSPAMTFRMGTALPT